MLFLNVVFPLVNVVFKVVCGEIVFVGERVEIVLCGEALLSVPLLVEFFIALLSLSFVVGPPLPNVAAFSS